MNNNIYCSGDINISNNLLNIGLTTINLSSISSIEPFIFPKHSLLFGLKQWFYGLILMVIICNIYRDIMILGDIYLFTIFILLGYNIYKHTKTFYGLEISINSGKPIRIKSDNYKFIEDVRKTIKNSINNKKAKYVINLNTYSINNGIINKGDNNKNTVVHK